MAAQRSAGAAANAVVGMNRSGQVQVFQSTPEPDVEAGLKQQQAKALSEQRAAQAALGRRTDELVAKQLQPQLAFERFAGKVFDPAASVQSQLRALSSTRTEFAALHAVGSANQSNFESPLERYYRLQHELKAFQSDLDALVRSEQHAKQSADQVKAITDVSVLLSADLKTLETELNGMAQNKAFAAFLTPGAGAAAAALAASSVGGATGALNAALQSVRDRKDDKKQTSTAAGDRAVLEIYSGAGMSSASPEQLQQLDKRLALIEKLVGGPEAASSSFPDIQTGLKALGKKLELLDAQRLDSLYRRVKGVLTELETLEAVKKEKLAAGAASPTGDGKDKRDAAAEEKIEQLYTLMTRWDTAAQSLPVVVARLQSLKEVHDECAGVALRLQSVEKTADAAQKTLEDDRSALATLTKNFASNMSVIQSNVTSLEARFTALQSKMDQLAKLKIVS